MDIGTALRSQEHRRPKESAQDQQFRESIWGAAPTMIARFYVDAYEDESAFEEAGYRVFKERIVIFLQAPDSRESQTYIADENYKKQFPKEWELFIKNYENPKLPITAIPQITPAVIATFQGMELRCLEDVIAAELPEPFQKYQKWAAWIKSAHEASHGRKMKVSA